jgi:Sulfotransferase family
MIYLSSYNLAFIKIPKNASTAIARVILDSNILSSKDVITHTTYGDTFISQNCTTDSSLSHITIDEAISLGIVPQNTSSFCIIRNPLERLLSLFIYRCKQGVHELSVASFHKLVSDGNGTILDHTWQNLLQTDFINTNSTLLLYDTISEDLALFWKIHFNQEVTNLKYINKSSNADTKELVPRFYTKPLIKLVSNYYEKDIILYDKLRSTSFSSRY